MHIRKLLKRSVDFLKSLPCNARFWSTLREQAASKFLPYKRASLKSYLDRLSLYIRKIFSRLRERFFNLKKYSFDFKSFFSVVKYRIGRLIKSLTGSFLRFKEGSHFPRFNSVKFEISVIYTLILGIILITFSGVFYVITSRTLYRELDHELTIKAQSIADNIRSFLDMKGEYPQTLQYAVEQTIAHEDEDLRRWWYIGFERSWYKKLEEQDLSEDFINFISLDKSFQVKSKNLEESLLNLFANNSQLNQNKEMFWNLDWRNEDIRVINYPYPQEDNPTHIIQVGISKGPVILLLQKWMTSVLISIPVILFLTAFIGRLLASRILRPLNRIIKTATNLSYENLNLRVEPKLHYQEMDRLIRTFNDMIARLEKSFKHINEFSIQVAHELKTPLTIIRGEAELLLWEVKSYENKKSTRNIIEEIDRIIKTIEDLLFLSKTCYQPESFEFREINLIEFLKEITEQLKLITKEKSIQFQSDWPKEKIMVWADKLHLRRLFFNLLDNALKFTPSGGKITIQFYKIHKKVYVSIVDTGIGISKQNLSKVFDQFFSEDHKQKGTGLGLSIALAIAKAHKGEIIVRSKPAEGTIFTVILPYINIKSSQLTRV